MNYTQVLKRIQDRIKAFGFSYRTLSKELGWPVSKVYNAVSGKQSMTARSLFELCSALDMHFVLFNNYKA